MGKQININDFDFNIASARISNTTDYDLVATIRNKDEKTSAYELVFNGFVRRKNKNYGEFAIGYHGNEFIIVFENSELRKKGQNITINYYNSQAVANNKGATMKLYSGFKAMAEITKNNTVTRLNFKLTEVESQPFIFRITLASFVQVTDKGEVIKKTADEYWKEKANSNGRF